MKFQAKHQGKWVASQDDEIIADAKSLTKLIKKIQKTKNLKDLKFSLVPKGYIAGIITHEI